MSSMRIRESALIFLFTVAPFALRAATPLRIQADTLPMAVVGSAFSYQLVAVGGGGVYSGFTCAPLPCPLPPGLSLSTAGLISGTPTAGGAFTPAITVTDSLNGTATQSVKVAAYSPTAFDTWCPLGDAGGNYSSVAMSPVFSTGNTAVAGLTAGGVVQTTNGGTNWNRVAGFDGLRVAALVSDFSKTPIDYWAVTATGVNGQPGAAIFHFDSATSSVGAAEISNPPGWLGGRRHIRQAFRTSAGAMLASDDQGGVLYKSSAAGSWGAYNSGLPIVGGQINVTNIAFGNLSSSSLGVALVNSASAAGIYTSATATGGAWSLCGTGLSGAANQWQALAMGADGVLIIGDRAGNVATTTIAGNCTPLPGPTFSDGGVPVKPVINGFVISSCYTSTTRSVYAITDAGVFFHGNVTNTVTPFVKVSGGLLSEEVSDLGVSDNCADGRLLVATRGHGLATGLANQLCHARTPANAQAADITSLAATGTFSSPSSYACGAGARIYFYPTMIGASPTLGAPRANGRIREFLNGVELREKTITGVAASYSGYDYDFFAASATGIYNWSDVDENNVFFFPTMEPQIFIRGVPSSVNAAAYGLSAGVAGVSPAGIYAANPAAAPWQKIISLPTPGLAPTDFAPGGPLSLTAGNDEMWIAYGSGGVQEFQFIAGTPALFAQNTGLNGLTVYRIAAGQIKNAANYVFIQARNTLIGGPFMLLRGTKANSPANSVVSFSASGIGAGLPSTEAANQIIAEPAVAGVAGYVWVLFPTQGVYVSPDAGATFTQIAGGGLPARYNPLQLVPAANFSSVGGRLDVALLLAGRGVFVSNDGGKNYCFGPALMSQTGLNIRNSSSSPTSRDDLLVATDDGVFVTHDRGANFYTRTFCDQSTNSVLYHRGNNTILAGSFDGIYYSPDYGQNWIQIFGNNANSFAQNDTGSTIVSAVTNGLPQYSTNGGSLWNNAAGPSDSTAVHFNSKTTFAAGAAALYWMVGAASGASYSATGSAWTLANGGNVDYLLTSAGGSWASVLSLGGTPSKVIAGNGSAGVYRTLDGADSWRNVSTTGSGLETTSKNAAALVSSNTAFGTTDVLVGMVGSTTGGVYLSGDNGEHWTPVNAGYDPNNLSISSLITTSCSGCPVQYYSGSYGGGLYTRTVTVVTPPAITGWCFAAACACGTAPASGPEEGGQAFKLCGTGFQTGAVVEFDGVPVYTNYGGGGCALTATTITCTAGASGTPAHAPLPAAGVPVRVRNPDTRVGVMPQNYVYTGGAPRVTTSLRVAKSGTNAALTWTCATCVVSNPARVYRSQNAAFTQYLENYNGGTSGTYSNTGALATTTYPSYFWSVE